MTDGVSFRTEPREGDRSRIRGLLSATGFFHEREIDVAIELIDDRLAKGASSEYLFVFADIEGEPAGFTCYGPITTTENRFDLYWIAVRPDLQGKGFGTLLLREAERRMRALQGRYVFAETSSRDIYEPTRRFYLGQGFREVARVPHFYADGDGKVIFSKDLSSHAQRAGG